MRDASYVNALPNAKAQREFTLTREQARLLFTIPGTRIATLAQTMGPYWRDIYWIPGPGKSHSCYTVVGNTTRRAVLSAIGFPI